MAHRVNAYRKRRLISMRERIAELEQRITHLEWQLSEAESKNHYLEERLNQRTRIVKK